MSLRLGGVELHHPPGSVAREPVLDVEALLEVVPQREAEERPPARGQLHRGGQPALHDREVARREVPVEPVDVGADLQPIGGGQRGRVDAGAGDDDHAQVGHQLARGREGGDHAAQERRADARAAHRDDADLLVGSVAELGPQPLAVAQLGAVEAAHVAGEVVVALGPVADPGQPGPEAVRHHVVGVADEQGAVADARVALDLLDHLGVVVGGERRLVLDGEPADEVGQPDVRGALELGVLVQVVVELPRLVADPEVVPAVAHGVVEDHEVRDEDLVHPPPAPGSSADRARPTRTRSAATRSRGAGSPGARARPRPRARR